MFVTKLTFKFLEKVFEYECVKSIFGKLFFAKFAFKFCFWKSGCCSKCEGGEKIDLQHLHGKCNFCGKYHECLLAPNSTDW